MVVGGAAGWDPPSVLACFLLAQVQGTNDSSVLSKASAAAQGYFRDAFIQHFVCRAVRRSPLINR